MEHVTAGTHKIEGSSTAGLGTSLRVVDLKVVLDAGVMHRSFAREENIFLSHCHMDHVGSLLGLIGARDLHGFETVNVYVPAAVTQYVSAIVGNARALGQSKVRVNVHSMGDRTIKHLSSRVSVKSFSTNHGVPSNGYIFFSTKQKLKPEFIGLDGNAIKTLKGNGVEITRPVQHTELVYMTDTMFGAFKTAPPEVLTANTLIMECTFLDDSISIESAHHHGHIHIDEIVANAELFEHKHIVLMHFSARYSRDQIREIVDEKLPRELRKRVQLILPEHV